MNHSFKDKDRNCDLAIDPDADSQPKIVKTWLRQIVDRLVSHSPRLICTNCNDEFFAAEIKVRISQGRVQEECPHCQAGSFRIASAEAAADTRMQEQEH